MSYSSYSYDDDIFKSDSKSEVKVSDLFVNIYSNFNVVDQIAKMRQLSKRELYLLLALCLYKFSDEDPVVKYNFQPFKDEVMEIFDIQDDKETKNPDLMKLINETGDKYIETDYIIDMLGAKLPEPLTKDEVRDAKINIINDDKN